MLALEVSYDGSNPSSLTNVIIKEKNKMNKLYNIDCIDIPIEHLVTVDLICIVLHYATGRVFELLGVIC